MSSSSWQAVADFVVGTTISPIAIAERFDVDEDDVEFELGKRGIETCTGCGWWFHDLAGHPDVLCEDCADH